MCRPAADSRERPAKPPSRRTLKGHSMAESSGPPARRVACQQPRAWFVVVAFAVQFKIHAEPEQLSALFGIARYHWGITDPTEYGVPAGQLAEATDGGPLLMRAALMITLHRRSVALCSGNSARYPATGRFLQGKGDRNDLSHRRAAPASPRSNHRRVAPRRGPRRRRRGYRGPHPQRRRPGPPAGRLGVPGHLLLRLSRIRQRADPAQAIRWVPPCLVRPVAAIKAYTHVLARSASKPGAVAA
jgi:hypothetical protein